MERSNALVVVAEPLVACVVALVVGIGLVVVAVDAAAVGVDAACAEGAVAVDAVVGGVVVPVPVVACDAVMLIVVVVGLAVAVTSEMATHAMGHVVSIVEYPSPLESEMLERWQENPLVMVNGGTAFLEVVALVEPVA